MSHYGYSKQLNIPFDKAVEKTITALKEQGFGVLTDIDVKKILKEKLNVDFKQYRILGACSPQRAYRALQSEEQIGLLMPCNVILYEKGERVVASSLVPTVVFSIVDNPELEPIAQEVEKILKGIIDHI